MPPRRDRIALVLTGLAVGLLLASVYLGWWTLSTDWSPYSVAGHQYSLQATVSDLPGSQYRLWCTVNNTSFPGWGTICPATQPDGLLNPYYDPIQQTWQTAELYASLLLLLWATVAVGIVALVFLLADVLRPARRHGRRTRLPWSLVVGAGLLAVLLPLSFAAVQPIVFRHDAQGYSTGVVYFWGSCHSSSDLRYCGINTSETWGAGPGWYLSVLAGALFLGVAVLLRSRPGLAPKDPVP